MSKHCCGCKQVKSATTFNKNQSRCRECQNIYKRQRYKDNAANIQEKLTIYKQENKEQRTQTDKRYKNSHIDAIREYNKEYREKNKEERRESLKKWRQDNPDKHKKWVASYLEKNRSKFRAKSAFRRASILKATPAWADLGSITRFYAECPSGYEVDHIIPLRGKNVCGLHVLANLQYLTISDNRSKGNKHEPN